ncbi:hypothetical protein [Saccharopolyspora thermophila]|uniref:hypothetical protein n=1 Tax=Saccharopolyspora thermophila TaxID=89367 RepID=UPI0031F9CCF9
MTDAHHAEDYADLPEQVRVRRRKLDRLRAAGVDPFMERSPRTVSIGEVREKHGHLGPDEYTGERVGVAGRVLLYRTGGKLCFATIRDVSVPRRWSSEPVGGSPRHAPAPRRTGRAGRGCARCLRWSP